jgi:hypothetical protein
VNTPLGEKVSEHDAVFGLLIGVPTLVLAYLEFLHNGEANELRQRAARAHEEANALTTKYDAERNEYLAKIAELMKRPPTKAQRNAQILRKYLRKCVVVTQLAGGWPSPPEIVDVSEDNIVSLFMPKSLHSSTASLTLVDCEYVAIVEYQQGSCPISMSVSVQHGRTVMLGEITRWEDRETPAAKPEFPKGPSVLTAMYDKPGTAERRALTIYASQNDPDSFLLESSESERDEGSGLEVSKRYAARHIGYRAEGFIRRNYHRSGAKGITTES